MISVIINDILFVACGDCSYALGNDTVALQKVWEGYWEDAQVVGDVQMLDSWLVSLDNQIVATLNALGTSQDRLDVLTEDVDALIAQEPGYTADVSTLENRVSRT